MPQLKDLARDLGRALKSGDLDQVASVRRTIVESFPETPEGAEASYKLGLDALYRRQDMEEAAEHLRAAAKSKVPKWSTTARVSLGIVLLRQGKEQQALFELRRVSSADPPTLISAQAAGMVVIALRQSGKSKDAERAQESYHQALRSIIERGPPAATAHAHYMIGMEHKFHGERGPAREHLEAALEEEKLPQDTKELAKAALEDL